MVYRRSNGANPIHQLRDEMDRLVSDFFGTPASFLSTRLGTGARGFPAINVWDSGEDLFAEAEVPGVKSEDVEISVVGNELTIRGQRRTQEQEGVAYHRQERGVGEFNRVLRLPVQVDANRVEASLKDGVLLVKMPKADSARPKKIQVSARS